MEDNEAFEEIVNDQLAELGQADQDTIDLLDVLAQDLANRGEVTSLYRSYEYATNIGKLVFSHEFYKDQQETKVTAFLGDEDEMDVLDLMFNTNDSLDQFCIDDEYTEEACEIIEQMSKDRTLTDDERLMLNHIVGMATSQHPELAYSNIFATSKDRIIHIAQLIKDSISQRAVFSKEVVTYAHSTDNKTILSVALNRNTKPDENDIPSTTESLLVNYTDGALCRRYSYCRDDGHQTLEVNYLQPPDRAIRIASEVCGLTVQYVSLLTDVVLARVFDPSSSEGLDTDQDQDTDPQG